MAQIFRVERTKNYTVATLSRDGIDSVRSAIKELEHHGYVERHRLRNEYGFYGDTEYIIREVPLGEEND